MANWCQIQKPANWSKGNSYWSDYYGTTDANGWFNPAAWSDAAKQALNNPFVFDADRYSITCEAFPSAGGSGDGPIANGSRISQLEQQNVSLQNQIEVLQSLSSADAPGFLDRIDDQAAVWSMFLGAMVVVLCARGIYKLFNGGPHAD